MRSRRYSGKYSGSRRTRKMPVLSWILILLAVASLSTGAVVAYLSTASGDVENTFTAADPVTPTVTESFANNVKTAVAVNVGDPGYSVYVRAAVVVTWKNGNNVLGIMPAAGTDYTISYNSTDWFAHGGYWYYKYPVPSGKTKELINSCEPKRAAPAPDYVLNVEIIAQSIQSLGTTDAGDIPAVQNAWGVYIDKNGDLTAASPTT